MRIVSFIFIFCFFNFLSIKSDDENNEITIEDTSTSITDVRSNAPIIKSSSSNIYFEEQFQDKKNWRHWIKSQAKKDIADESISKYDGEWAFEVPQSSVYKDDYGLVLKSKAKHHAISINLNKPFDFSATPLILQYEVKFPTKPECGGAYIKLLSNDEKYLDLEQVTDKTPYTIMFGPDMCGAEYKYHFILRFRNPKTGLYTEHQAKKSTEILESYFIDKKSHLYTLVLSDDNNFKMYIDNRLINSGNLLQHMEPSIIPSKEIIDETDRKPDDWDEQEKIVDINARKPDDWDETAPREIIDKNAKIPNGWLENEPLIVPDPDATKPEDWNDEMDGVWEAPSVDNPLCKTAPGCGKWTPPMIPNPAFKGPWSAPLIDNPKYQGKWEARKIPNPDYFEITHPYKLTPIGGLALELWSLVDGIVFDNFILTSDQSIAKRYADQLWNPKSVLEGKAASSPTTTTPSSSSSWKNLLDTIINAIKDRPWLLAVYSAVLLLLITAVAGYCWWSTTKSKTTYNGMEKKDDDYTDDNEEQDEETEEINQRHLKSKRNRKAMLENDDKKNSSSASNTKPRRRTRKE